MWPGANNSLKNRCIYQGPISPVINLYILLSPLLTKTKNLNEKFVVPEEWINRSCNLRLQRTLYFRE